MCAGSSRDPRNRRDLLPVGVLLEGLALGKDPQFALIGADRRIQNILEDILDSSFLGQDVIEADEIEETRIAHHLFDRLTETDEVDIASEGTVGIDRRFEHFDAREVDDIDAVHSQHQIVLAGVILQIVAELLLDVVDSAEKQRPTNVHHRELRAHRFSGRVYEVPEQLVGDNLVYAGQARPDHEEGQRKEDSGEDRKIERLDQGRQERHGHDRAFGARGLEDPEDLVAFKHPPCDRQQYGRDRRLRDDTVRTAQKAACRAAPWRR